ncbi:extensin-like domain-containing protein [Rhodobacter ferrooxidans]|uniref:extensin-like domain-containing protein n=1 Tax=Rhodobacter ferrooxidans TaxID=371731 RepID=UPI001E3D42A8|nr:extensin family protein [Rhodobacter sp. SW2]
MATAWMLLASGAFADAPDHSPRPLPRPGLVQQVTEAPGAIAQASAVPPMLRPKPRPAGLVPDITPEAVVQVAAMVPRPKPRPAGLTARATAPEVVVQAAAVRTQPGNESLRTRRGAVCGDAEIRGEAIAPITSRVRGCGVPDAVRITAVAGVRLSQAATIDCPTARALKAWVQDGLQPQFRRNPVVQLQVAAHYACRPRNNKRGAKISEHGRGRALDISGLVLADGRVLTVADNWRGSKPIKAAYRAACGVFGTTLGPGSDGYHEDHMHFDTARYRSGSYCR